MKKWILILPLVLLALVACAPGAESESEEGIPAVEPEPTNPPLAEVATEPATTAVPTDAPPAEPTAIPTDALVTEPTDVPTEEPVAETAVVAGRLDEGAFFLGAPDAPVTMIDYSDFL